MDKKFDNSGSGKIMGKDGGSKTDGGDAKGGTTPAGMKPVGGGGNAKPMGKAPGKG